MATVATLAGLAMATILLTVLASIYQSHQIQRLPGVHALAVDINEFKAHLAIMVIAATPATVGSLSTLTIAQDIIRMPRRPL